MGAFEYLLLFTAIILGLAVSDLAMSLHRLLGAGKRVRWDWLAPLAAVVAFLKIVTQWWSWHSAEQLAGAVTFEMFLTLLVAAVLLFLLAAAALPDEAPRDETIDLRLHYAAVSRRYWLLFLGHWLVGNVASVWVQIAAEHAHFTLLQPAYLIGLVIGSLILIRNRWWHTICLLGFVAIYLVQFFGQSLSG
ncbi:MAG: hypothetical protein E7812_16430 [Phenylobacterium sp.]|nr:MAG: hypothetical protein E7812_16430 [Phenylobacterium sp.]